MVQTGHAAEAAVMAAPASDGGAAAPSLLLDFGGGGREDLPSLVSRGFKMQGEISRRDGFSFFLCPFFFLSSPFPHFIFRYITKILAAFPEMLASLQNLILLPMGLKLPVPFMLEFRRKSKIFKVGLVSQDFSTNPYFHK